MTGVVIELVLKADPGLPLDMLSVIPTALVPLTVGQVEAFPIRCGNRDVRIGDFFSVTKSEDIPHTRQLTIEPRGATLNNLGAGMDGGKILVHGDTGLHTGSRMSNGVIIVEGSAGDWLGAEMREGHIEVHVNAGNAVGGAYRGSRRGMSGGTINVLGNVGNELGLLLRRGLITVWGNVGEYAGASMIAGTILVEGTVRGRLGAGMKRGTIALRTATPDLPPGFVRACTVEKPFTHWYDPRFNSPATLYRGDVAAGGRGEVFVFNPAHRD